MTQGAVHPALEFVNEPALAGDPGALRSLLLRFGPAPPHDPTPDELRRIAALHEAMRQVADAAASGRTPSGGELADLNEFLASVPVRMELAPGDGGLRVTSTPVASGWDTVVRDLAGRLADLLTRRDSSRLRRCAAPDCGRFFYDGSRSGNRRWHDPACGNLVRVRRFRAR